MDASASGHSAPPARPKKRTGTSKYDFIKVKVWLGEDLDHYYILSRFLICRMLTVTRIPYIKAVKIALETKKHLVDNNMHDVTQAQLEEVLFSIVRAKGFDEAHIDCYRMVTQFYQSRQPLCIIICGAAWTGKSTLAQQLASRINIPNVMQTDVIYELLRAGPDSLLQPTPLWARPGLAGGRCCDAALVREFRREARVVREGMEGDLIKTLSDGKPIIIEGFHLDPGLYIPDFGSRGIIMLPARPSATLAAPGGLRAAVAAGHSPGSSPQGSRDRYRRSQTMLTRAMRSAMSTAAAAAAAAAGVAGEPAQQAVESQQADASEQQQQQQQPALLFQHRSASANAEVSVSAGGPLSPGSLVTYSNAAADAALEPGLSEQQQVDQQQEQQKQQQQKQRLPDGTSGEQQVAALPPLPPLRLRKQPQQQQQQRQQQEGLGRSNKPNGHVSSSQADCSNGHVHHRITAADAAGTAWPTCSLHQSDPCWQHMGTPFADLTAADAVCASDALDEASAAAAAGCGEVQRGELFDCSREQSVVMFDDVQVCAAAAEAAALHQHHHEQQQHQQQQMLLARPAPGSPFSSASDVSSVGVGGGSPPCISQEHSTTEVVSTVCSCASLGSPALRLSKEPSAAEIWSPANSATGGAAAAAAAAAEGFSSSGVFMSRQLSSGHQMRVTPSPRVSSRQLEQLPEEEPDLVAQQQQQQQQSAGHHLRVNCSPKVSTSQLGQLPEMEQSLVAEQQHEQEQQEQGQRQLLSGCPAPTPSAEQQQQQQHRGEHGLQTRRHEQPASCPSPATAPASQWDHGEGLPAAAVAPAVEANGTLNAVQQARSLPVKQAGTSSAALPARGLQPGQQSQQQQQSSSQQQQSHHQQQQQHGVQQQSQSDSTGLDRSHAAAPQPKSNGSEPAGRPLFVPILVYMDEADQALMAEEALAHLGLPAGKTTELMGLLASSTPEAGADGSSTGVGVLGGGPAADGGSAGSSGSGVGCGYQTRSSSGEGCVHAVGRSEGMQGLVDVQQQQQQDGVSVAEALRRVRLLQEYLCAYEAQGLPVVKVSYGAFGEALDRLHEYVLQCIKVAMQSRQAPV